MPELSSGLNTEIARPKNYIDITGISLDLQSKRVSINAILAYKSAEGVVSDAEAMTISSSPEMVDPNSFKDMLNDLFPDNDAIINPRKALRLAAVRIVKKALAAKYGMAENAL